MNDDLSPAIWDTFLYSGEEEILKFRLSVMNDFCNNFLIVESAYSFSGTTREVSSLALRKTLNEIYTGKIHWIVLNEYRDFKSSWGREAWQRNQIGQNLENMGDEDIVLLSDIDEIPNENFMKSIRNIVLGDFMIAKMTLYYYCPHFKSNQVWFGSIATKGKPKMSFQELRSIALESWKYRPQEVIDFGGRHLSSIGNADFLLNKIQAFSHTEFNVWPYTSKLFLRLLILLGISFDGNEIFSYEELEYDVPVHLCKRDHKFDFLRIFAASLVSPISRYVFKKKIFRLSGPTSI